MRLLTLLLAVLPLVWGQQRTIVVGDLVSGTGQPLAGRVTVTWPRLTTTTNAQAPAGRQQVNVSPAGRFTLALLPSYSVAYQVDFFINGDAWREYWLVPPSVVAVDYRGLRTHTRIVPVAFDTNCLRADFSTAPCGGAGGSMVRDTMTGSVNGSNRVFTLAASPSPSDSLMIYRNGILQRPGVDFDRAGTTVTFLVAATPQVGDLLESRYQVAQ